MSVVRPIPKRASDRYYNEAHREGLTLDETNRAAMLAHDWHRKWTRQDEANHTMPEEDFYKSTTAGIPASYACDQVPTRCQSYGSNSELGIDLLVCLEREEGAKNPSLGSSPEDARRIRPQKRIHPETINLQQQHAIPCLKQAGLQISPESKSHSSYKRNVLVSSTEASTCDSSEDSPSHRQVKKIFIGFDADVQPIDNDVANDQDADGDRSYESYNEDDADQEPCHGKTTSLIQRPLPFRPMVVKPVAIHANRPDFVFLQPTNGKLSPMMPGKIPRDIITNQFDGEKIVSPMSNSQFTGSSAASSRSSLDNEMIGITVLQNDQEGLPLVEDEPMSTDRDLDSISTISNNIEKARDDVLHVLAITDGDVESDDFNTKLDPLEKCFLGKEVDTRNISRHHQLEAFRTSASRTSVANSIEGMWLTLSKPNWFGKLGQNDNGDPMYTLGRMSFDMFSPTNLVCSLQGNFNHVEIVSGEERKAMLNAVPKKLREEVESGKTVLRTYHIVTAFTIEPSMAEYPNAPNKDVIRPIKGIMTTYGYSLPDPDTPNRHSIWFTGGRIEPNNDASDILLWKNFFTLHPPKHSFGEKAKLLAVKLLMGATIPEEIDPEDGSMNYVFTRPLGGHGMAYVDVIYLDESLRIVRGQRGTTFVFSRVPDK